MEWSRMLALDLPPEPEVATVPETYEEARSMLYAAGHYMVEVSDNAQGTHESRQSAAAERALRMVGTGIVNWMARTPVAPEEHAGGPSFSWVPGEVLEVDFGFSQPDEATCTAARTFLIAAVWAETSAYYRDQQSSRTRVGERYDTELRSALSALADPSASRHEDWTERVEQTIHWAFDQTLRMTNSGSLPQEWTAEVDVVWQEAEQCLQGRVINSGDVEFTGPFPAQW